MPDKGKMQMKSDHKIVITSHAHIGMYRLFCDYSDTIVVMKSVKDLNIASIEIMLFIPFLYKPITVHTYLMR